MKNLLLIKNAEDKSPHNNLFTNYLIKQGLPFDLISLNLFREIKTVQALICNIVEIFILNLKAKDK